MKTTKVRDLLSGWRGNASLYRLDRTVDFGDVQFDHVIASTLVVGHIGADGEPVYTPETSLFPARPDGTVTTWDDTLPGSSYNVDHADALAAFTAWVEQA